MGSNSALHPGPKWGPGTCVVCGCLPAYPPRRWDASGRIIEGCVARAHDNNLYGASAHWHNRPAARAVRAATRAHERTFGGRFAAVRK